MAIIDQLCSSGSIYSIIDSSILDDDNKLSQVYSLLFSFFNIELLINKFLFLILNKGLVILPLSLQTLISFSL